MPDAMPWKPATVTIATVHLVSIIRSGDQNLSQMAKSLG